MQSVVGELGFDGHALGDVAIYDDESLDFAAIILDGAGRGLEGAPFAIFVTKTILEALPDACSVSFASSLEDFETIVRMNLLKDRSLSEFFRRIAEDLFVRGAVVEAMTFGVDERDHIRSIFGNDAEELFALGGAAIRDDYPELLGDDDEDEGSKKHGWASKKKIGSAEIPLSAGFWMGRLSGLS